MSIDMQEHAKSILEGRYWMDIQGMALSVVPCEAMSVYPVSGYPSDLHCPYRLR
jgi:hypothetical protein